MSQGRELDPPDGPAPVCGRWIEGSDGDRPEDRAGALFRAALRREPLEADRLAVIGERLRVGTRRARPRRVWQVAVAFGLMLSGSALTAAANWYFHRSRTADAVQPQVAPLAHPSVPPKPRMPPRLGADFADAGRRSAGNPRRPAGALGASRAGSSSARGPVLALVEPGRPTRSRRRALPCRRPRRWPRNRRC